MAKLFFIFLLIAGVILYFQRGLFISALEKFSFLGTMRHSVKVTSSYFANNSFIPAKYTCDGENSNPPLSIADVPGSAQSLVLIVDDPDAPGGDWVHWILINIPPGTVNIDEQSIPEGAKEGMTSFGKPEYGGPCPPSGTHRYVFTIYALDVSLPSDGVLNKQQVLAKMQGHILDTGQLIGLYGRQ